MGEGSVLLTALECAVVFPRKKYKRWTSGNWQGANEGVCSVIAFIFLSFFFFFSLFFLSVFFFKVVILKLQDYTSLSHIVIQVPPTVGNKVKKKKKGRNCLLSMFTAFRCYDRRKRNCIK